MRIWKREARIRQRWSNYSSIRRWRMRLTTIIHCRSNKLSFVVYTTPRMRQASLVGFDTIIASGIDENLDSQLLHAQKNIYTLAQVCQRLSSGKSITAADIQDSGEYPVYGANGVRGYTSVSNFKGECAIIGRQGAYCGNVHYFSGEAYMSEHAVVAHPNEISGCSIFGVSTEFDGFVSFTRSICSARAFCPDSCKTKYPTA